MRTKGIWIIIIMVFFSCFGKNTEGNDISELGFYSSPEKIIASLEKNPGGFREHFLLGYAYRKKGNLKRALLHYSNSCFSSHRNLSLKLFPQPVYAFVSGMHIKSELYDDALAEISEIFLQYREYEYCVRFADRIRNQNTALYRDAVIVKSKALDELHRDKEAVKQLRELLAGYEDTESRSLIHLRIASILDKADNYQGALKEYIEILKLDEVSWQAGIASARAMEILNTKKAVLSTAEKLMLSKALYASSKCKDAVGLLGKTINEAKDTATRLDFAALLVRCYVRTGRPQDADGVIRTHGVSPGAAENMMKIKADELWSSGRKAQAVTVYTTLQKSSVEVVARESMKRIALYMEDRRAAGFEKYLAEYKDRFRTDPASEYFLWLLGKEALRRNDNKNAVLLLEEGLSKYPDGEYSDRFRFWLYKIYLAGGETGKSDRKLMELTVHNPDSSYTWRILQRKIGSYKTADLQKAFEDARERNDRQSMLFNHTLLFLAEGDMKKRNERLKQIPWSDRAAYEKLPVLLGESGLKSASKSKLIQLEKYFAAGYQEGIVRELNAIPDRREDQKDKNIILSLYGSKYHNYYFMVNSTLEVSRSARLPENIAVLPEEAIRRVLPEPFTRCVNESSTEFKVDAAGIYAVIKAESLFNHRAVSSAGAVGLMQLMPPTAKGIARTIKLKEYDLKDPCTSIRLGAHYIAWLDKFFKGNFDYMVAGYNAGAGNVKKWQKDLAGDQDYFMEFIPFDETRYYILRTGKFLFQYRILGKAGRK